MLLDIPAGARFFWNPYSPKYYTIVSFAGQESSSSQSTAESSVSGLDDEEYDLGWATISSLRREPTDSAILDAVYRLPHQTLLAIVGVLESSPSLMLDLCEKDRGNVIGQLMTVLGGNTCIEVVHFALENAYRLSTNQSGCIAFTRIYDCAPPGEQRQMAEFALEHFDELSLHPFGNYVIQRVLEKQDRYFTHAVSLVLRNHARFFSLASNKFGSHVVESFLRHSTKFEFLSVAEVLFQNDDLIVALSMDKHANYVLQNSLRLVLGKGSNSLLVRHCKSTIPKLVVGSPFALNINRALGITHHQCE